jgi:hypothetical protein
MIEMLNQFALDALADSFETMAFMSPMPTEEPHEAPSDAVLVSIFFTGSSSGIVELVTPRDLGKLAATNILGVDPGSSAHYDDALKELLNILGGLMLRRWILESRGKIEISLPKVSTFDVLADWPSFIASPGATVLNVEDNMVALRVREYERNRVD